MAGATLESGQRGAAVVTPEEARAALGGLIVCDDESASALGSAVRGGRSPLEVIYDCLCETSPGHHSTPLVAGAAAAAALARTGNVFVQPAAPGAGAPRFARRVLRVSSSEGPVTPTSGEGEVLFLARDHGGLAAQAAGAAAAGFACVVVVSAQAAAECAARAPDGKVLFCPLGGSGVLGEGAFEELWRAAAKGYLAPGAAAGGAQGPAADSRSWALHLSLMMCLVSIRGSPPARPAGGNAREPGNAVLLFDTRGTNATALAACCALTALGPSWRPCIVAGGAGCEAADALTVARLREWGLDPDAVAPAAPPPSRGFSVEVYNRVMKDPSLWEALAGRYGRVLVVQDDACLARRGLEESGAMESDFCGAPWPPSAHLAHLAERVGNGGLSLRNPAAMAAALGEAERIRRGAPEPPDPSCHWSHLVPFPPAPWMSVPEDVFFAEAPEGVCAKAPESVAGACFSEMTLAAGSLGYHAVWKYSPHRAVARHLCGILAEEAAAPPGGPGEQNLLSRERRWTAKRQQSSSRRSSGPSYPR